MTRRTRAFTLAAVTFVGFLSAVRGQAAPLVCPLRLEEIVLDDGQDADIVLLDQKVYLAWTSLASVPGSKTALRQISSDVIDIYARGASSEERFKVTIRALMRFVGEGTYGRDEMARTAILLLGFRDSAGVWVQGLLEAFPTPGSSSWLSAVTNRGHLLEIHGTWNLLDGMVINGRVIRIQSVADIEGFGVRVSRSGEYLVEGDLVARIDGLRTLIDFKGADGHYVLDEVDRVLDALENGLADRFVFAHQTGAPLPGALQERIDNVNVAINLRNIARSEDGLPLLHPIEVWDVGGLRQ